MPELEWQGRLEVGVGDDDDDDDDDSAGLWGDPLVVSNAQLRAGVRRWAASLREEVKATCGVDAHRVRVGIVGHVSASTVLAILAAWDAGCSVVPVDPLLPWPRAHRCLSLCHVVVATIQGAASCSWIGHLEWCAPLPNLSGTLARARTKAGTIFSADVFTLPQACCDEAMTALGCTPLAQRDELHVYHTSGTTGRPKPVVCTATAMLRYASAHATAHDYGPSSRVLLASAVSFDPFIGEVVTTLVNGGTLVVANRKRMLQDMGAAVRHHRITHVMTTPAIWGLVDAPPSSLPSLRVVMLGGEALPSSTISTWAGAVDLYNVYGTTEATVYQLTHKCSAQQPRPSCIGHPLLGVDAFIVPLLTTLDCDEVEGLRGCEASAQRDRAEPKGRMRVRQWFHGEKHEEEKREGKRGGDEEKEEEEEQEQNRQQQQQQQHKQQQQQHFSAHTQSSQGLSVSSPQLAWSPSNASVTKGVLALTGRQLGCYLDVATTCTTTTTTATATAATTTTVARPTTRRGAGWYRGDDGREHQPGEKKEGEEDVSDRKKVNTSVEDDEAGCSAEDGRGCGTSLPQLPAAVGERASGFYVCHDQIVYLTGDVVTLAPNSAQTEEVGGDRIGREFCFVGRRDDQVKVSGQRVSLLDIERTCLRCRLVRSCKCIQENNSLQLHACVNDVNTSNSASEMCFNSAKPTKAANTPTPLPTKARTLRTSPCDSLCHCEQGALATAALHLWCAAQLPLHMVPARIHIHAALPRTPNDKVDAAALREHHRSCDPGSGEANTSEIAAPEQTGQQQCQRLQQAASGRGPSNTAQPTSLDDLGMVVLNVWMQTLHLSVVEEALSATFFECGGDSLAALRLVNKLRAELMDRVDFADEDVKRGNIRGWLGPLHVLQHPTFHAYLSFLRRHGATVPARAVTKAKQQHLAHVQTLDAARQEPAARPGERSIRQQQQQQQRCDAARVDCPQPAALTASPPAVPSTTPTTPSVFRFSDLLSAIHQLALQPPVSRKDERGDTTTSPRQCAGQDTAVSSTTQLPSHTTAEPPISHVQSLLLRAVASGTENTVRTLTDAAVVERFGVDVTNGVGGKRRGVAPLHRACQRGHPGIVKALLDGGASVTSATHERVLPAHFAAAAVADTEALCLQLLLEHGTPIRGMDGNKQTMLHWAARAGHVTAIHVLTIGQCKQPQAQGSDSNTVNEPRQLAPANASSPQVACDMVDVNACDRWFRTPLHWALVQRHFGVALALLRVPGIKVTFRMTARRQAKRTALPYEHPLHLLARTGGCAQALCVFKAIAARLDTDIGKYRTPDGLTVLHSACTHFPSKLLATATDLAGAERVLAEESVVAEHIVRQWPDLLHARDKEGHLPLFHACKYMNVYLAQALMHAGCEPSSVGVDEVAWLQRLWREDPSSVFTECSAIAPLLQHRILSLLQGPNTQQQQ